MSDKTAQKNTWGGFYTAQVLCSGTGSGLISGASLITPFGMVTNPLAAGADVQLWSGPGRLDSILINPPILVSGTQITFYDGANPTSGGPFFLSGHRRIAIIQQYPNSGYGSGQIIHVLVPGTLFQFSTPFQSGLCVALKSGQPGWTTAWSQERPGG